MDTEQQQVLKPRAEVERVYRLLLSYMNVACDMGMFDDPADLLFARLTGNLEVLAWLLEQDEHRLSQVFGQQLATITEIWQKALAVRELQEAALNGG